jgi:hypothetical protein
VDRPFRLCDNIAWRVSSVEGAPRVERYWPEEQRDRAIQETAAFLEKYRDRFMDLTPDGQLDPISPNRKRVHLAFPILGRPATREDVRAARAIYSLEGEGEVRLAKVPAPPIKARWITYEDAPIDYSMADGTVHREYDQDG